MKVRLVLQQGLFCNSKYQMLHDAGQECLFLARLSRGVVVKRKKLDFNSECETNWSPNGPRVLSAHLRARSQPRGALLAGVARAVCAAGSSNRMLVALNPIFVKYRHIQPIHNTREQGTNQGRFTHVY